MGGGAAKGLLRGEADQVTGYGEDRDVGKFGGQGGEDGTDGLIHSIADKTPTRGPS